MSRSIPFRAGRPVVGLASLLVVAASLVAIGAVPVGAESSAAVSACPGGPPVLEVGNPNPGDVISQGDYIISGVAFDPELDDPHERAVHAFASSLVAGTELTDADFAAIEKVLGRAGIAEVLVLLGYYSSVSLAMRVHQVPIPQPV